jgi:hypothetical protein
MRDSLGGFAYTTMPSPHAPFRSFSVALATTVGLFALAFWIPQESIATTLAVLSLLLGLPISILLYRDGLRTRQETSPSSTLTSAVLALPVRILGATCLIAGLAILAWVAYNVLIERQPEFTGIRFGGQLLTPVLLVVFGYRWVRRPTSPPPR